MLVTFRQQSFIHCTKTVPIAQTRTQIPIQIRIPRPSLKDFEGLVKVDE